MIDKKKKVPVIVGIVIVVVAIIGMLAFFLLVNGDEKKAERKLKVGNEYLLELKLDDAIIAFEQVLELDPKNVEAYRGIISAYMQKEDIMKALKYAEKAYKNTKEEEFSEQIETIGGLIASLDDGTSEEQEVQEAQEETEESEEPDEEADNGPRYAISKALYYMDGYDYGYVDYELDDKGNTLSLYSSVEDEKYYFYEYDEKGRLIAERMDSAYDGYEEYRYFYDDNDRRIRSQWGYHKGEELSDFESYEYNEDGLLSITTRLNDSSYTVYDYDDNKNLVSKTYYNGENEIAGWYIYEYDSENRLVKEGTQKTDGTFVVSYSYEYSDNTMTKYWYSSETDAPYSRELFTYDENGNVIRDEYVYESEDYSSTTTIVYEYKVFE